MRSSRTRPEALMITDDCDEHCTGKDRYRTRGERLFAVARDRLPGAGKVAEVRRQAFEAFERLGLPHRRIEEWKYTDLRALMREVQPLAPTPDAAALERARGAAKSHAVAGAPKLVLVDGVFAPELSDAAALERQRFGRCAKCWRIRQRRRAARFVRANNADAMISLNARDGDRRRRGRHRRRGDAFAADPYRSRRNRRPRRPLPGRMLQVGKGARATLVESFVAAEGAGAYQVHDAVILWVGDAAELEHVRLMADAPDAVNITTEIITVGAKAKFNMFNMTSGGAVSRYRVVPRSPARVRARRDQRRQPAQWPAAWRHHAGPGSCRAALREPRDFPRRGR